MTTPSRPPSDAQNQGAEEDRVRPQDTANNFESTPRRSVSFSGQPQEHGQVETESSADEHTTIIRRQRGGDRSYSGTAQSVRRSSLRAGSSPGGQATQEQQKQSNSPSASHEHDQPPKLNWWKSFLDKYGTVELQNKGSVARDHLALGMSFTYVIYKGFGCARNVDLRSTLIGDRAHISRLAKDIIVLC